MVLRLLFISLTPVVLTLLALQWSFARMLHPGASVDQKVSTTIHSLFGFRPKIQSKPWKTKWFLSGSTSELGIETIRWPPLLFQQVELDIDLWPHIIRGQVEVHLKARLESKPQMLQMSFALSSLLSSEPLFPSKSQIVLRNVALLPWLKSALQGSSLERLPDLLSGGRISVVGQTHGKEGAWSVDLSQVKGQLLPGNLKTQFRCEDSSLKWVWQNDGWQLNPAWSCTDPSSSLKFSLLKPDKFKGLELQLATQGLPKILLTQVLRPLGCSRQIPSQKFSWVWEGNDFMCRTLR